MSKINEANVSELHGVWAGAGTSKTWVEVCHIATGVEIRLHGFSAVMGPDCARRLAQQLQRIARRVEARQG